ncbi:MAG TPA: hypothetical protein VJ870_05260 [Amycolatopsis sp.]|nr:hypothetical protein [Amycolatopsis sp.]
MTGFVPDAGQPEAPAGDALAAVMRAASGPGSMLSDAAVASAKGEVQKLVDSAKSGGFAISEEGADEYIKVFQGFEDQLADLQRTAYDAGQAPALGTSEYATRIANHTQLIATGDAQSYETALGALASMVQQARAAFEMAKKNYAQMDDEAARTFDGTQVGS